MNLSDYEPQSVIILGDPHENVLGMKNDLTVFRKSYPTGPLIALALGDMNFYFTRNWSAWSGELSRFCVEHNIIFATIDGNHEHFPSLNAILEMNGMKAEPIEIKPNIFWLPRGTRWNWHNREWLAVGGAHSIDRAYRVHDDDWFTEEEITRQEADKIIADGPADVMITHDCPAGVHLSLPQNVWPEKDVWASNEHRKLLAEIFMQTKPSDAFHGHYHMGYSRPADIGYGEFNITGLSYVGDRWSVAVVDLSTMETLTAW